MGFAHEKSFTTTRNPTLKGSRIRPHQDLSRPHQTPHHRGDSYPPDPTPQQEKEGEFPTHQTHTTARKGRISHPPDPTLQGGGKEGGDSKSNPPQPTPQEGGGARLPRPFEKGVGGAAWRVTIYMYTYVYTYRNRHRGTKGFHHHELRVHHNHNP